jgi:hypothetical protein
MSGSDNGGLRRGLVLGVWAGLALWMARATLLPAAVRNARLSGLSGAGPVYAELSWTFGAGARPISVIFDIELPQGAAGSVTTDGEALEAEVPLIGAPAPGPYALTASATYRILGLPRTVVYRFSGRA